MDTITKAILQQMYDYKTSTNDLRFQENMQKK